MNDYEVDEIFNQAEDGAADAQFKLGGMYAKGEGVAKNLHNAVEWWTRAAAQRHDGEQHCLGRSCLTGEGALQDERKAFEWCEKAAGQGHLEAQFIIGRMYETGRGVEKDECAAVAWYKHAAANTPPLKDTQARKSI